MASSVALELSGRQSPRRPRLLNVGGGGKVILLPAYATKYVLRLFDLTSRDSRGEHLAARLLTNSFGREVSRATMCMGSTDARRCERVLKFSPSCWQPLLISQVDQSAVPTRKYGYRKCMNGSSRNDALRELKESGLRSPAL